MSTLINNILSIVAPKGVIPDLAVTGKTPAQLEAIARFFSACAGGMAPGQPGETSIQISKGSTNARLAYSSQLVTFASCLAATVIEVNGVKFTAFNGAGGGNRHVQHGRHRCR
jgi:hypothetical protein